MVSAEPQPRILAPSVGSSVTGHPSALSQVRPLPWGVAWASAARRGCCALLTPAPGPELTLAPQKEGGKDEGGAQTRATFKEVSQRMGAACRQLW